MIGGGPKRNGMSMGSLVAMNARTGTEQVLRHPRRHARGRARADLRPARAEPEGDGYVIVPVSKRTENKGEYLTFDTNDISDGPIARTEIAFLLGWTPHGHWMDLR